MTNVFLFTIETINCQTMLSLLRYVNKISIIMRILKSNKNYHRCEASTMELARRNDNSHKTFFRSIAGLCKVVHSIQNLILRRMIILLFIGHTLEKMYTYNPILLVSRTKNLYKIFLKHVRWVKVSLLDAELNSKSNGLVCIDRQYFWKKLYVKFYFVVLAPWC